MLVALWAGGDRCEQRPRTAWVHQGLDLAEPRRTSSPKVSWPRQTHTPAKMGSRPDGVEASDNHTW